MESSLSQYDPNAGTHLVNYDGTAAGSTASLLAAQWQNYLDNYSEYEDKAIEFATTDKPVNDALSTTRRAIDRGFANSQRNQKLSLSSYGVTETPRQAAARKKTQNLKKGGLLTQNLNSSRQYIKGLQDQVLSGDVSLKSLEN